MRTRRGLTLIEILAAAVLLAALAAFCAPLIRDAASRAAHTPEHSAAVDSAILSLFADSFLSDPRQYGVESIDGIDSLQFTWPEAFLQRLDSTSEPSPITVQRLASHDPQADHEWIVFSCEGVAIGRWRHRPPQPGGLP